MGHQTDHHFTSEIISSFNAASVNRSIFSQLCIFFSHVNWYFCPRHPDPALALIPGAGWLRPNDAPGIFTASAPASWRQQYNSVCCLCSVLILSQLRLWVHHELWALTAESQHYTNSKSPPTSQSSHGTSRPASSCRWASSSAWRPSSPRPWASSRRPCHRRSWPGSSPGGWAGSSHQLGGHRRCQSGHAAAVPSLLFVYCRWENRNEWFATLGIKMLTWNQWKDIVWQDSLWLVTPRGSSRRPGHCVRAPLCGPAGRCCSWCPRQWFSAWSETQEKC